MLTGAQLPALQGAPGNRIWAYRYDAGAGTFIQVPVQVDERAPYDLTQGQAAPNWELTYDWLGAENGSFDGDDELAIMARDAGARAPDTSIWVSDADETRTEVRIEDPITGGTGWIYLYTSSTITDADPGFTYAASSAPDPASGAASVDSAVYSMGYNGRWRLTRLSVNPGPDLLDRVKARAFALVGSETEETEEQTSHILGARSGKVRALREVQGAASRVMTTIVDQFYRDTWRRPLNLRVHAISRIWYSYDYLPQSPAGRFFSSLPQATGIPIDGVNDPVPQNLLPPAWSQTSLSGGTLVMVSRELSPFPLPPPSSSCYASAGATFYWRDDAGYSDSIGSDGSAIGNHGVHLRCLADTNYAPYSTQDTHYFLPPRLPTSPSERTTRRSKRVLCWSRRRRRCARP